MKCTLQVAISEVVVHAMNAYRGSGCVAPQILYLATKVLRVQIMKSVNIISDKALERQEFRTDILRMDKFKMCAI